MAHTFIHSNSNGKVVERPSVQDRTGRRLQRAERAAGRGARLRAWERETEREFRAAVRGTWIEAEFGEFGESGGEE